MRDGVAQGERADMRGGAPAVAREVREEEVVGGEMAGDDGPFGVGAEAAVEEEDSFLGLGGGIEGEEEELAGGRLGVSHSW